MPTGEYYFETSYSQDIPPPQFRDRPYLMKSFREDQVDALARELGQGPHQLRKRGDATDRPGLPEA